MLRFRHAVAVTGRLLQPLAQDIVAVRHGRGSGLHREHVDVTQQEIVQGWAGLKRPDQERSSDAVAGARYLEEALVRRAVDAKNRSTHANFGFILA